jgi:hypothetical protein
MRTLPFTKRFRVRQSRLSAENSTGSVIRRVIALLDVSLNHVDAQIGPLTVAYEDIIVGALMLVGIGLSFMVLPARR